LDKFYKESVGKVDVQTIDPSLLERIAQAIGGLRFGSVEIVIQDGRVVQIERKEKFRLDARKDGPARVTALERSRQQPELEGRADRTTGGSQR